MNSYLNPWHNPLKLEYGPRMYETEAEPIEHLGFLIYQSVKGFVWDVVKDGKCVTQRAGVKGAKQAIESLQ